MRIQLKYLDTNLKVVSLYNCDSWSYVIGLKLVLRHTFWKFLPEVRFNPQKVRLDVENLENPKTWKTQKNLFLSFLLFGSIWGKKDHFGYILFMRGEIHPMQGRIDTRWNLMSHQIDYLLFDIPNGEELFRPCLRLHSTTVNKHSKHQQECLSALCQAIFKVEEA